MFKNCWTIFSYWSLYSRSKHWIFEKNQKKTNWPMTALDVKLLPNIGKYWNLFFLVHVFIKNRKPTLRSKGGTKMERWPNLVSSVLFFPVNLISNVVGLATFWYSYGLFKLTTLFCHILDRGKAATNWFFHWGRQFEMLKPHHRSTTV